MATIIVREVTIDSYKALPPHVLLDSSNFFPVLDPTEKYTYLEDLQKACTQDMFCKIWQRATSAGCFTSEEEFSFSNEFGLSLKRSAVDDVEVMGRLVQKHKASEVLSHV